MPDLKITGFTPAGAAHAVINTSSELVAIFFGDTGRSETQARQMSDGLFGKYRTMTIENEDPNQKEPPVATEESKNAPAPIEATTDDGLRSGVLNNLTPTLPMFRKDDDPGKEASQKALGLQPAEGIPGIEETNPAKTPQPTDPDPRRGSGDPNTPPATQDTATDEDNASTATESDAKEVEKASVKPATKKAAAKKS